MITYEFTNSCKPHLLASHANLEFALMCQGVSKSRAQQHVPATIHLSAPALGAASLNQRDVFIICHNVGAPWFYLT